MNKKTASLALAVSLSTSSCGAFAGCGGGWFDQTCQRISDVAHNGAWDLYVTGYGWHIDGYGDRRHSLNANSYGFGVGKHLTGANGHQDMLFAFAFLDSHKNVQPIAGYARQWFTRPVGDFSVGGGYFIGVTARQDILHYVPIPIGLPIGSLRYKRVSLMATFIPHLGSLNEGNLAFFWGRYEF
ncbi:antimicrobial peptide resistance and lipid A acylation PagP [Chitinasiproducens palmae]|uniref:Antimicrobial peptide resistance and lipid A acylation PagP n=1 Tax=Chitinasiproducens palmae TaxID=1770053 RepID=A0A1H2PV98_9BURK|nr:antimicrobial peptide resistance and lipid A acylation PagP [Chitinasiproducens palmae]SDV51190.1 Antimicrobial peptide resistance and lipid A acylation PagP [Chitinasiproducens palmae]